MTAALQLATPPAAVPETTIELVLSPEVLAELGVMALANERNPRMARFCPLPDPFASHEEAQRYINADLPQLDAFRLWQELHRAELRLILEDNPCEWLKRRHAACRAETTRRAGGVR
jgi:hypothetical protein